MEKATLIYDTECPLCRRAAQWALENALPDALEVLPCGSLDQLKRFPGILQETCEDAPQLVLPDGIAYSGEALIPPLLDRLKRWHWAGKVLRLPLLAGLAPLGYRTLAINRHTLSVLMYRK